MKMVCLQINLGKSFSHCRCCIMCNEPGISPDSSQRVDTVIVLKKSKKSSFIYYFFVIREG